MLKNIVVLGIIFLLWALPACTRAPFACFRTDVAEADIHVNQPVTFSAYCSSGAGSYFWEFYDKEDSTEYGFSVTKTFATPGDVKVFLLVVGNGKTSSTERYITVQP
jgi:hypothetical protein